MGKMLIADDNQQIVSIIAEYAKKEGFIVVPAGNGTEALEQFHAGTFDIVLLDVMMPNQDGFEVCRAIRKTSEVPIIMVTARGEDFDRIMGLDIGADDYIVKPFSPGELMARVRAILRRIGRSEGGAEGSNLTYDNLTVSLNDYQVSIGGEPVSLTKKELELLWLMASHKGKVFTRDNLLDSVWGYDYFGDSRTVDSHIKRLRAKVDQFDHPSWQIATVWGVGYKFEVTI